MRKAWQKLHILEKVLLGLSLLVIIGCAAMSWQSLQRPRAEIKLQESPGAQEVKWDENARILIDISGAVQHPDIVRLPKGARVQDAIAKAGGLKNDADTSQLNRAKKLKDGEKIYVPSRQETQAQQKSTFVPPNTSATPEKTPKSTFSGTININQASEQELQVLPGVGPVMAARIVEYRSAHGAFSNLDDLDEIKGVGPKTLEKWQELVVFH